VVRLVGDGYHLSWLAAEQLHLVEVDADGWKTWVHQRLATPVGTPGAMTFFRSATPQEHLSMAKHLTAESKTEEFIAGKGVVTKWERIRRQNHWLDAVYNASAAAHGCGARLVDEVKPEPPPKPPPSREHMVSETWMERLRGRGYPGWLPERW
jgi:hypothetical protein